MIGKHLNNYEIVSLLGEGGMGTVYLALHPIMGRKAAVKVLKPELARDETLVSRFFNEARAANAIRHPNIIDIIDVGLLPEDNVPYMLMEFLEGESLSARLERIRPLAVPQAVEVASQTASALAAAHSKGIVHRDLKPDNLFLVPDEMVGSGERVKVLDFGIAKLRDDLRGSSMKTRTGAIMGTAAYMSPEQCQGLIERIDHRTDIYALGIILYEMLCGAPPFMSEGFGDIIIMHVMKEADPPHLKNPMVPPELSAAILRALSKDPADRFQSMTEFQAALRGNFSVHTGPISIAPQVGTTAILDEPRPPSPSRPPVRPPSNPQFAYDATMATPAPVSITPGVFQTAGYPAQPEPPAPVKQTTTFRNAAGEATDLDFDRGRKRRTGIAVAAIVGLAAAGLVATYYVTRPTPGGPAATEPAPRAVPAAPAPEPVPAPTFTPPPPEPAIEPPPPPADRTSPPAAEEKSKRRKRSASRTRKIGDKSSDRTTVKSPERPSEPVVPPPPTRTTTERW
ncbi:MAG: serine/threonine protein kinase [Deltaproteobacteria bacterium]|nr:serine/threonine protein kinase [Deltaproteobacteria bacterium]